MITRRTLLGGASVLTVAAASSVAAAGEAAATGAMRAAGAAPLSTHLPRLTNLAHLRWLMDSVPLTPVPQHSTFDIDRLPTSRTPWTYANSDGNGGWTRVGGGSLDPATGHWSQGAYNADDIARAAVVFVRDWQATASAASRDDARDLLRTLAYLQDDSGPNAGDVVLWLQADGTLTPSAIPVDQPNPSDSAESYWLARTVWAFGEASAAFARSGARESSFAGFLRQRMELALDALERGPLSRYGTWLVADDVRVPGWLVTGGADATAEACLGLTAYVRTNPHNARARTALTRLAEGVAAMRSGRQGVWPFGAIIPGVQTQSLWHAWGGEAPQALCRAGQALGSRRLLQAGLADAGSFTPQLLTSGGPYNSWSPVPGEAQIAYGAEGRVAGLLAAADATGSTGFVRLAGLAGGWFFGANPSGQRVYDPATGATFDGVEFVGRVNVNSGAESTIHGLLAMLALDAHPEAAALAASVTGYTYAGLRVVEAESGTLAGGASVVTPPSTWNGAANWSGGLYVSVPSGGSVRVPVSGGGYLHPIINRRPGDLGSSRWYAVDAAGRRALLGTLANGGLKDVGVVPADGLLKPFPLARPLPRGTVEVVVESDGDLQLDALLVQPLIATTAYERGSSRAAVLYVNAASHPQSATALSTGRGRTWTASGEARGSVRGSQVTVTGGGFAITD